jgi:hypothetical protein
VLDQISELAGKTPGVDQVISIAGISALDNSSSLANAGVAYLILKEWSARGAGEDLRSLFVGLNEKMSVIEEARVLVIPPPPIQGIGNAAGFAMQVQLRDGNADYGKLQAIAGAIVIKMVVNATPVEFKLPAKSQESDPAGKASRFESKEQALGLALDNQQAERELVIPIGDKTYNAKFEHFDDEHHHRHEPPTGQRSNAMAPRCTAPKGERPSRTSLSVLNTAITAAEAAGSSQMNDVKPAWLPVWPTSVRGPSSMMKKPSPRLCRIGPVFCCGVPALCMAITGRHISASVDREITASHRRRSAVSPWVALVRNAAYVARSVSGAFHPPLGIVIPGSNSRPFSRTVSWPAESRTIV